MELGFIMQNSELPEIKSLSRAASVLELFARADRELTFSEVASQLGMSKATAHRFLAALTDLGFLRRTGGGHATFALGLRLIELGAAAAAQIDLRGELHPFLAPLTDRTLETSNLAILVGGEAVVVDQVESPNEFRMFARIGRSVPPGTSSLGKVLFAHADEQAHAAALAGVLAGGRTAKSIASAAGLATEFEQVRERGYALDLEENRVGVVCVGAPVRDVAGRVVAAISVSGPSARLAGERLEETIATVLDVSNGASQVLGWRPDVAAEAQLAGRG
jgi:DNA-binding IclR family transcriptional regulator